MFVSNLASFLEKRGEPLRIIPRVDGRDLDLFKLFTSVVNRGGYQVVRIYFTPFRLFLIIFIISRFVLSREIRNYVLNYYFCVGGKS